MWDIPIREAKREDAIRMAQITAAAWQTAYTGLIDPEYIATRTGEYYTPKFQQRLLEHQWTIFVAEVAGHVVGYATGDVLSGGDADCEVKGLYVHPDYQGMGVGRKLLEAMQDHFRTRGCHHLRIWTTLGAKNNGFYQRMGGTAEGEQDQELGNKKYKMVGFGFLLSPTR